MNETPRRIAHRIELPPALLAALRRLESAGARCRVVGGSVRDSLLGLQPKDFDVEVYGIELEAIADALSKLGKTDLVGRAFCVVKLWMRGAEYDFSVPRRESKTGSGHRGFAVEADPSMSEAEALKRRDFTLNALLYDPIREEVLDYCGGKADLDAGVLRHVSDAFSEDPLRALRAMQFAGRFSLQLHPETAALCAAMRREFWTLPVERVWGEWEKWSARSVSLRHGMEALLDSGWLPFFAELNALRDLPQDPEWHPEGNVWIHTLCCLDALQRETDWKSLPEGERSVLAFATLCHDLGKARCTRFAEKRGAYRWVSPGHEAISGWLSLDLLGRIGAARDVAEKVSKLVSMHHYLNSFPDAPPGDANLRRLARRLEPANARELAYVIVSDHHGRPPLLSAEYDARIARFRERLQALDLQEAGPRPILFGRHLIELGMEPGPEFKPYLDEAYEAQLDGAFEDEDGARAWIRERLARSSI